MVRQRSEDCPDLFGCAKHTQLGRPAHSTTTTPVAARAACRCRLNTDSDDDGCGGGGGAVFLPSGPTEVLPSNHVRRYHGRVRVGVCGPGPAPGSNRGLGASRPFTLPSSASTRRRSGVLLRVRHRDRHGSQGGRRSGSCRGGRGGTDDRYRHRGHVHHRRFGYRHRRHIHHRRCSYRHRRHIHHRRYSYRHRRCGYRHRGHVHHPRRRYRHRRHVHHPTCGYRQPHRCVGWGDYCCGVVVSPCRRDHRCCGSSWWRCPRGRCWEGAGRARGWGCVGGRSGG